MAVTSHRHPQRPGSAGFLNRPVVVVPAVVAALACAALFFLGVASPLYPQTERKVELTAQEMLARADRVLEYPAGIMRGRLMHITPSGKTHKVDVTGYIDRADFLFSFSTAERGEQMKVLYNYGGEDIWVYNILSTKLFHKLGVDKYDPVVFTNFSFMDFSNSDLQSNYTAKITGDAFIKGEETYRLTLTPVFRGGAYGTLTLYVTKDRYVPRRIDFQDTDNVIFKTLSLGEMTVVDDRPFPVRYDMLDIRKGTLTVLSFHGFDRNVKFDRKIFMHQMLGK